MFLGCSNNIFDQKLEKHEKFNLFRYEIATIGNKFLFSISSLFDFGKEGLIDNDVVQYKKLTEKKCWDEEGNDCECGQQWQEGCK